ncbi:hypothetical protein [[Mycoplasma] gypis]|uniref:ECM-binding protein homolog n=1 Tax=[Mycoplasma] gypis TaxID=92404 RepID=A0ABZ2RR81_9BACT|nr:hypothetical protein [[Mycoplasma] gypis]MBN0919415.1 hypothetical protein [[Mycoplasma] gypis]
MSQSKKVKIVGSLAIGLTAATVGSTIYYLVKSCADDNANLLKLERKIQDANDFIHSLKSKELVEDSKELEDLINQINLKKDSYNKKQIEQAIKDIDNKINELKNKTANDKASKLDLLNKEIENALKTVENLNASHYSNQAAELKKIIDSIQNKKLNAETKELEQLLKSLTQLNEVDKDLIDKYNATKNILGDLLNKSNLLIKQVNVSDIKDQGENLENLIKDLDLEKLTQQELENKIPSITLEYNDLKSKYDDYVIKLKAARSAEQLIENKVVDFINQNKVAFPNIVKELENAKNNVLISKNENKISSLNKISKQLKDLLEKADSDKIKKQIEILKLSTEIQKAHENIKELKKHSKNKEANTLEEILNSISTDNNSKTIEQLKQEVDKLSKANKNVINSLEQFMSEKENIKNKLSNLLNEVKNFLENNKKNNQTSYVNNDLYPVYNETIDKLNSENIDELKKTLDKLTNYYKKAKKEVENKESNIQKLKNSIQKANELIEELNKNEIDSNELKQLVEQSNNTPNMTSSQVSDLNKKILIEINKKQKELDNKKMIYLKSLEDIKNALRDFRNLSASYQDIKDEAKNILDSIPNTDNMGAKETEELVETLKNKIKELNNKKEAKEEILNHLEDLKSKAERIKKELEDNSQNSSANELGKKIISSDDPKLNGKTVDQIRKEFEKPLERQIEEAEHDLRVYNKDTEKAKIDLKNRIEEAKKLLEELKKNPEKYQNIIDKLQQAIPTDYENDNFGQLDKKWKDLSKAIYDAQDTKELKDEAINNLAIAKQKAKNLILQLQENNLDKSYLEEKLNASNIDLGNLKAKEIQKLATILSEQNSIEQKNINDAINAKKDQLTSKISEFESQIKKYGYKYQNIINSAKDEILKVKESFANVTNVNELDKLIEKIDNARKDAQSEYESKKVIWDRIDLITKQGEEIKNKIISKPEYKKYLDPLKISLTKSQSTSENTMNNQELQNNIEKPLQNSITSIYEKIKTDLTVLKEKFDILSLELSKSPRYSQILSTLQEADPSDFSNDDIFTLLNKMDKLSKAIQKAEELKIEKDKQLLSDKYDEIEIFNNSLVSKEENYEKLKKYTQNLLDNNPKMPQATYDQDAEVLSNYENLNIKDKLESWKAVIAAQVDAQKEIQNIQNNESWQDPEIANMLTESLKLTEDLSLLTKDKLDSLLKNIQNAKVLAETEWQKARRKRAGLKQTLEDKISALSKQIADYGKRYQNVNDAAQAVINNVNNEKDNAVTDAQIQELIDKIDRAAETATSDYNSKKSIWDSIDLKIKEAETVLKLFENKNDYSEFKTQLDNVIQKAKSNEPDSMTSEILNSNIYYPLNTNLDNIKKSITEILKENIKNYDYWKNELNKNPERYSEIIEKINNSNPGNYQNDNTKTLIIKNEKLKDLFETIRTDKIAKDKQLLSEIWDETNKILDNLNGKSEYTQLQSYLNSLLQNNQKMPDATFAQDEEVLTAYENISAVQDKIKNWKALAKNRKDAQNEIEKVESWQDSQIKNDLETVLNKAKDLSEKTADEISEINKQVLNALETAKRNWTEAIAQRQSLKEKNNQQIKKINELKDKLGENNPLKQTIETVIRENENLLSNNSKTNKEITKQNEVLQKFIDNFEKYNTYIMKYNEAKELETTLESKPYYNSQKLTEYKQFLETAKTNVVDKIIEGESIDDFEDKLQSLNQNYNNMKAEKERIDRERLELIENYKQKVSDINSLIDEMKRKPTPEDFESPIQNMESGLEINSINESTTDNSIISTNTEKLQKVYKDAKDFLDNWALMKQNIADFLDGEVKQKLENSINTLNSLKSMHFKDLKLNDVRLNVDSEIDPVISKYQNSLNKLNSKRLYSTSLKELYNLSVSTNKDWNDGIDLLKQIKKPLYDQADEYYHKFGWLGYYGTSPTKYDLTSAYFKDGDRSVFWFTGDLINGNNQIVMQIKSSIDNNIPKLDVEFEEKDQDWTDLFSIDKTKLKWKSFDDLYVQKIKEVFENITSSLRVINKYQEPTEEENRMYTFNIEKNAYLLWAYGKVWNSIYGKIRVLPEAIQKEYNNFRDAINKWYWKNQEFDWAKVSIIPNIDGSPTRSSFLNTQDFAWENLGKYAYALEKAYREHNEEIKPVWFPFPKE